MKHAFFIFLLAAVLMLGLPVGAGWAAEDAHDHQSGHSHDDGHAHDDNHDEGGHDETDGDDHGDDHSEDGDSHDDHGHDAHDSEDSHDDHGHGGHGDEHGEHEEGKTEIVPEAAKQAGIKIETTAPAMIGQAIPLTGRITINQNTKAEVRARFPGIVRSVKVNLGEQVKKGQVLAVIESNESLKDYNVTAPIDGTILARNTNLGDVANGAPLFTIANLSLVWAKFHVFPKDADHIKPGQTVRVHTLDETKEGTATIDMLFPTADALSQTLVAIAPLGNQNGQGGYKWRPGMTVEGDVMVSQKQVPVAVRESALQTMEDQTVVFVKDGNSFEMTPVKTGMSDGSYVEILSGLPSGKPYVSEGSFIIKADILKSGAAHEH